MWFNENLRLMWFWKIKYWLHFFFKHQTLLSKTDFWYHCKKEVYVILCCNITCICYCPGYSWWYPCCFVIVQDVHDDIPTVLSLSRMFMMISPFCCPGGWEAVSWWPPSFGPHWRHGHQRKRASGSHQGALHWFAWQWFVIVMCRFKLLFLFTILKKILYSCLNCSCIKVGLHLQNIQVQLWKIMEWVCSLFVTFFLTELLAPLFPLLLSRSSLCVAVEYRWIHISREGEGESMRDLGKSIDYLLIFVSECMSGDGFAHLSPSLSLSLSLSLSVCVTWLLFDRRSW